MITCRDTVDVNCEYEAMSEVKLLTLDDNVF